MYFCPHLKKDGKRKNKYKRDPRVLIALEFHNFTNRMIKLCDNFPVKKQQKLLFLVFCSMKIMFATENFLHTIILMTLISNVFKLSLLV